MSTTRKGKGPLAALRICGNADGNTAVEFGLFLPVIMLVLLAAVELGRYGVEMNRLTNAARAGMQYAIQSQGHASADQFIKDAVREDAGDAGEFLTISTTSFYRCTDGSTPADPGDDCPDGSYAPMYVSISVSETFDVLFPLLMTNPAFSLPSSFSPTATLTARVR